MSTAVVDLSLAPPAVEPTSLVSTSSCQRKAYLSWFRNLTPAFWNPALRFGSTFHDAMDELLHLAMASSDQRRDFVAEGVFGRKLDLQVEEHRAQFPDYPPTEEEITELRALGEGLLPLYWAGNWTAEGPGWAPERSIALRRVLYVEQAWKAETQAGTPCAGRFDAVFEDEGGGIWIRDKKTCASMPGAKLVQIDKQFGGYQWAGYHLWGDAFRGVLVDHIRKQMPTPRVKAPLFRRMAVPVNLGELAHWEREYDRAWELRNQMQYLTPTETTYSPGLHCSFCSFYDVCMACRQLNDEGVEAMLSATYVTKPKRFGIADSEE